MPRYAFERKLRSYFVNRAFLKDGELFIHEKAKNFQRENYDPDKYKIIIQDSLGTQTLASIDEFQYSQFPNDTKSMQLEYEAYHPEHLAIKLHPQPTLKIDIAGD